MDVKFPRARDQASWAWGLKGSKPVNVWERFSPSYEAQAERLMRGLEHLGLCPVIAGAGSEDGEFVAASRPGGDGTAFFFHLEDPANAKTLSEIPDARLKEWILGELSNAAPAERHPAGPARRRRQY